MSGGTDYGAGSNINSTGALAPDLSKITAGYNLFTNSEKYDVDFLLMGSANYNKDQAASLASLLVGVAGQRKDAVAFISPYRAAFLSETGNGTSNTLNSDETITNNVPVSYTHLTLPTILRV